MRATNHQQIIEQAIQIASEMNPQATDGTWLEDLTVQAGPYVRDWDIETCHHWSEWPERETLFPNTTNQDVGIDAVAIRHDGTHIAIQCKSRQLDERGAGAPIVKVETDKFVGASADAFWTERWLVTNGAIPLAENAQPPRSKSGQPIKLVNLTHDLNQERAAPVEECPHCAPNPENEPRRRTRSCMQDEAVAESVRILREHEQSDCGGLPIGQARGKIILPCGTGKTRVSLRIVEQLTRPGQLSLVLCPSIALVAQIRREYLQHATQPIRALAVCSDETAGYDPKKEGSRDTLKDPTLDDSHVSASVVKGKVTTDPSEIAQWIGAGRHSGRISVVLGTYQSGRAIAEGLAEANVEARVLIADEAHRTAGLRRKKSAKPSPVLSRDEERVRDFTLCHDNDAMPATYRVYQTATPRVYSAAAVKESANSDWIVRSMDDESTFGIDLYRKSYREAVQNGWLSDYRIIAVGVNGDDVYEVANQLAQGTESKGRKGRNRLTTSHFLRGMAFALAMGGAAQGDESEGARIQSCIAFMNTVDKSKNMAKDLQQDLVKSWVAEWLAKHGGGRAAADFSLEHLDATSNVALREGAKHRLATATETKPHGVVNVGIFGEGVDSPSLSAVAFLEPRRSPIDVIQAVGRAMRAVPDKSMGYVICPIVVPPNADAEQWLSTSRPEDGWQELGQILLALRAHDNRIEDNLADLLELYLPTPPRTVDTFIGVARPSTKRIEYFTHEGAPGKAQEDVERVLKGAKPSACNLTPAAVSQTLAQAASETASGYTVNATPPDAERGTQVDALGPTTIITGKVQQDGSYVVRTAAVERDKPKANEVRGRLNIRKTKGKAKDMINKDEGRRLEELKNQRERRANERDQAVQREMKLKLREMNEFGDAIRLNVLEKSGLTDDRVQRDLNILRDSIREAAYHLNQDELRPTLDRHFGLDNLEPSDQKKQADGCTIAALLMMNAAMLHQRIAIGGWIGGVSDLETVKSDVNVARRIEREWNQIMREDFRPVLEPAVEAIYAVQDTGKLAGLERALRHIAAEAERIAEAYADMGADHAGPLFNQVMGNQASDGAYFTRPVAASIAARLTLDACGERDWTDSNVWRAHKTVDLACGSGTLLAAMLTDMKRRARKQGADAARVASLHKLAVEETFKGLDINPVSLQLAASQLTAGNDHIRFKKMGLHLMPYGPKPDKVDEVSVGTLELLGQSSVVRDPNKMDLGDDEIESELAWRPDDETEREAELEDAVDAVQDIRIVVMNPPFTNRAKMGEKFPAETQRKIRERADALERGLLQADPDLEEFADKNSIRPLFVALAEHVQKANGGYLSMINPTIALSSTSGLKERQALADRFHIHTVVTSHQPRNINMSQNTSINESIVVMRRHAESPKPPTRFVHLDRMPMDEIEVDDLHRRLLECANGQIANGWGEVSHWPAERMADGDWTPAIWRSPKLPEAANRFADDPGLQTLEEAGLAATRTDDQIRSCFEPPKSGNQGEFPILKSKGANGQTRIESQADEYWVPQNDDSERLVKDESDSETEKLLKKASCLLVTDGQRNSTARLTAVASERPFVGVSWMPVPGLSPKAAMAIAVFLNSTAGRLQILNNAGRTIEFPLYRPASYRHVRIPDVKDARIRRTLADCWERTKDTEVPQFRDGECEVRRLWDEAVAEAMGWDPEELARLRNLLHNEPHVRGLGYNQYSDELEDDVHGGAEPDSESSIAAGVSSQSALVT